MAIRLRRKRRRWPLTAPVVEIDGWCPDCGQQLENVQGTRYGAVRGDCPEHGPVDDALTA